MSDDARRPAIRPVVWSPPAAPPRARHRTSERPLPALRVVDTPAAGPEDVVVDAAGHVYSGLVDGRIVRLTGDRTRLETVADTGGRPLGVELLGDGRLLVCDANRGLLAVDPGSGDVEVLLGEVDGVPMRFCNNAAVASDGTVYFSDSSRRFGVEHYKADLLEHAGTGRLLCRRPDGEVHVLLDGLHFSNGVALAPDESYLVVAETGAYRLTRLWLTGPDAGRHDVLVDNLPGFPDNISTGTDGLVWVALASPRNALLDRLSPRHPLLRRAAWAMPERLQPKETATVWVIAVDGGGQVVHDLQGAPVGGFHMVTGVREHHGTVWLGSLVAPALASFDLG